MRNLNTTGVLCCLIFLTLLTHSCSDFGDLNNIERAEEEIELAVPLVNTEFKINDFFGENAPENVSLVVDEDGRATVVYNGDVVRQTVAAVFPPVPFFGFPLLDTSYTVPIPFASDQRVDKAVFGESNISLGFVSQFAEDVEVTVTIPQLSKDGELFKTKVTVPYEGSLPVTFTSTPISVEDWTLISEDNIITH